MANATVTRKPATKKFVLELTRDQLECISALTFAFRSTSQVADSINNAVDDTLRGEPDRFSAFAGSSHEKIHVKRDIDTTMAPVKVVEGDVGPIEKVTLELSLAEAQALRVVTASIAGDASENGAVYAALGDDLGADSAFELRTKNYPAPFLTRR